MAFPNGQLEALRWVRQHGCVWNAYASLNDTAAAAALEHRLCVPHPLSTKLYSQLLLSTFGDDGMPLASTQAAVPCLMVEV